MNKLVNNVSKYVYLASMAIVIRSLLGMTMRMNDLVRLRVVLCSLLIVFAPLCQSFDAQSRQALRSSCQNCEHLLATISCHMTL